jgi:dihydroxyacetone kinase-like protein
MEGFLSSEGPAVLEDLVRTICDNAGTLSEIDGATGDGDHGVNMSKGFSMCAARLAGTRYDLAGGLTTLGAVLMDEIGGAMGPLYGTFFYEMAKPARDRDRVDGPLFQTMLERATDAVITLGGAHIGDKTLVDALAPALHGFASAIAGGSSFAEALLSMGEAAERGKESTRGMVAKIGRASRLGERSRGVLDAGAASCALILGSLAVSMRRLLTESPLSTGKGE